MDGKKRRNKDSHYSDRHVRYLKRKKFITVMEDVKSTVEKSYESSALNYIRDSTLTSDDSETSDAADLLQTFDEIDAANYNSIDQEQPENENGRHGYHFKKIPDITNPDSDSREQCPQHDELNTQNGCILQNETWSYDQSSPQQAMEIDCNNLLNNEINLENDIIDDMINCNDFDDFNILLNSLTAEEFCGNNDSFSDSADSDEEYDENYEKFKKNKQFVQDFSKICANHNDSVPQYVVDEMLNILRTYTDAPFPKTYNALVGTPRSITTVDMDEGKYCHFDLKDTVKSIIAAYVDNGLSTECIELMLSVDGAPLAKSSVKGLWIISVSEPLLDIVEPVGIYYGPDKPKDSSVLMQRTVEELTVLINDGVVFDEKKYDVILDALVCDAPAKAYILKVKQHSGYWSCLKCRIKGENINHRQCFPGEAAPLRNHDDFKENNYADDNLNDGLQQIHTQGETIMKDIPKFDCIKDVVVDSMHLIFLGVVLKLIVLWSSILPILSAIVTKLKFLKD